MFFLFSACTVKTVTGTTSNNSVNGSCPAAVSGCTSATGGSAIPTSSTNVIPVYVADPATTGAWWAPNSPLVSVTVCSPNHTLNSQCQVISNVLLDTGSYGLRIFKSALTNAGVVLNQQTVTVSGKTLNLGECETFGIGADWGAVMNGDIKLGNQTASNTPIQVIDNSFGSMPSSCAQNCPNTDPCSAGYNGIIGVGPYLLDPGSYYACSGTSCSSCAEGSCMTASQLIVNPISKFGAGFNNGFSLTLPSVSSSGNSQVTGTATLGIGSVTSSTGNVYASDSAIEDDLNFMTVFQGTTYGGPVYTSTLSFLDSGSNMFFFPWSAADCTEYVGLFCPGSTTALSATVTGYNSIPASPYTVNFSVGNGDALLNSGNTAFNNVGASMSGWFDWGLPFFFGRTVYVGLEGKSATVNGSSHTGPYWAF